MTEQILEAADVARRPFRHLGMQRFCPHPCPAQSRTIQLARMDRVSCSCSENRDKSAAGQRPR